MSVQEVSAEELAGLDDEDELLLGAAAGPQAEVAAEAEAVAAEGDAEDDLGFVVDGEAEQDYYSQVATEAAQGVGGADGEEEEYEEEEQQEPDQVVAADAEGPSVAAAAGAAEAAGGAEEDGDDDDDIMFFEDTAADSSAAVAAPSPDADGGEEPVGEQGEGDSGDVALCTNCGLPGHDTTKCPFGHPEDLQLGDMEESDSDDDLPQKHPIFARYVSQHTGALVPKFKKGMTGQGRFFGDDKKHNQCWVCGAGDHESNDCTLKRCFFCGEPGHDSRGCAEKAKICSHCRCKGHAPVACPTLASQELVSFANIHCLRCSALGHANCGPPPLTAQAQRPVMEPQVQNNGPASRFLALASRIGRPMLPSQAPPPPPPQLFNMGLPPPTPASPPPSPSPGSDSFSVVRPPSRMPMRLPAPSVTGGASKAASPFWGGADAKAGALAGVLSGSPSMPTSKAAASMTFLNGGPMPAANGGRMQASAVKSPGKASSMAANGTMRNLDMLGAMPTSKSGNNSSVQGTVPALGKAPISKVPGIAPLQAPSGQEGAPSSKAAITGPPGKEGAPSSKAAITKMPGTTPALQPAQQVPGKAPITKVPGKAPISKVPPGKAPISKMPPSSADKSNVNLMKASAKRPSNGKIPAAKKAKAHGKGW